MPGNWAGHLWSYKMALIDDLESYFKLQETGASARVDSKNARNLSVNGTNGGGTGKIGGGFDIGPDAVDNLHYTGSTSHFHPSGNAATLTFWVKLLTVPPANNRSLIGAWESTGSNQTYLFYVDSTGNLMLDWRRSLGSTVQFSLGVLSVGTWYFIALTYKKKIVAGGLGYVQVKINDVVILIDVSANSITHVAAIFGVGHADGNVTNGTLLKGVDAVVDEIGYWSRELSGAELTTLYNGGNGYGWPLETYELTDQILLTDTGLSSIKTESLIDTLTITDAAHLIKADQYITDTLTLIETVTHNQKYGVASDTLLLTDSTYGAGPIYISLMDNLLLTDAITAYSPIDMYVIDSLTLTENVLANIPINVSVSDTLIFAQNYTEPRSRSITDNLLLTDVVHSNMHTEEIIDTITLTDSESHTGPKYGTASDTLTLTDSLILKSVLSFSLVDCLNLYDSGNRTYEESLSDIITFTDLATRGDELVDQLLLTQSVVIGNLDFLNFPCNTDVVKLNYPLVQQTLTLTDSVIVSGNLNIANEQHLTLRHKVIAVKVNTDTYSIAVSATEPIDCTVIDTVTFSDLAVGVL